MKNAVTLLEPFMDKNAASGGPVILLATVQGDVHDIGKNLADIILSNNGYTVHNIGIKIPAETIIQKARETKADIIGLSGLLVKSAIVMQESLVDKPVNEMPDSSHGGSGSSGCDAGFGALALALAGAFLLLSRRPPSTGR